MAKKIVVVEDDAFLLKVYKSKFKASDYEVTFANDGEEGLAMVKQVKPDLVLLDLIMPRMDGFEVLQGIREDASIKDTKVIVLTNLSQAEDKKKCEELGALEYIVKSDIPIGEVIKKVEGYVN